MGYLLFKDFVDYSVELPIFSAIANTEFKQSSFDFLLQGCNRQLGCPCCQKSFLIKFMKRLLNS